MSIGGFVFLILAVVAVTVIVMSNHITKQKESLEQHLNVIPDFTATQSWFTGHQVIAFDEARFMICVVYHGKTISHRIASYKDILSAELIEDGMSVSKTVRSSQIGGALVGGLALGGIGALLGGLTGKKKTIDKAMSLDLRILVNDTVQPVMDVMILRGETARTGATYQALVKLARHWHGIIEILIKRADTEDKVLTPTNAKQTSSASVADELKKLVDLQIAGVLTMDEYQAQKAKLLS